MSLTKNERKDTVGHVRSWGIWRSLAVKMTSPSDTRSRVIFALLPTRIYRGGSRHPLENFSPRVKVDADSYRFPSPIPLLIVSTLYPADIIADDAVDH